MAADLMVSRVLTWLIFLDNRLTSNFEISHSLEKITIQKRSLSHMQKAVFVKILKYLCAEHHLGAVGFFLTLWALKQRGPSVKCFFFKKSLS